MNGAAGKLPVAYVILATGLMAVGLAMVLGADRRCSADPSVRPVEKGVPKEGSGVGKGKRKITPEKKLGVADGAIFSDLAVTHRSRIGTTDSSGPISALTTQLLTVLADSWRDYRAKLRRHQRDPGSGNSWKRVGKTVDVVLGRAGYGWGRGLHGNGAPKGRPGPVKREGDGRSPAGVFALGMSYGYAADPPARSRLPYQKATASLRCVDDPQSAFYNQVVDESKVKRDWDSAEDMRRSDEAYELAVFVEHNTGPAVAAAGSCIFVHLWAGPNYPVAGCTAMARRDLETVMQWLRPNQAALVALPRREYRALQRAWDLPSMSGR